VIQQCTKDTSIIFSQPDSLTVLAQAQNDLCSAHTGSINLTVSGGTGSYNYTWSTGDTTAAISNLSANYYYVTVTDQNKCSTVDTVGIEDNCGTVVVHNGFTPNGDGINDQWVIDNIQNYPNSEVKVFDKWGNMVFTQTGYNNTWTADGLPSGTYYYMVKLNGTGPADKKDLMTGYIYVKR
jgi:gliding motility-associated-like protein